MNWEYVNLGSVCKTGAGGTPLKSKNEYYENGTIPWLRSGEVNNRNITECEVKISEEGFLNSSAKLFPSKTVLIAMYGATAGEVGILNFECSTNQAVCGILPNEKFIPEFLYYFFLDFKNELILQAVGNAQPNISQAKIRNTLIPLISIKEQKQIVAILDKAFAAIDQAKANIEKNIQNAQELFQSKLNEIFSQKVEGWEEKTLGEVCEIKPPKKLAKEKLKEDDLVSFVPMKYLGINQMHFNSSETKKLKNAYKGYVYFEDGDVILAKITPCFENGKLGIAKELKNGIGFGSSEYVVYRPGKTIQPEYLYFYLNRDTFRKKGTALMSGAVGHKRIQPDFYENELIFLPKIEEQKLICEKVTKLQSMLYETQLNYENKLSSLEELKKSILQKAFAGELTS